MGEISLRHIPDLSDTSAMADFSDASFQIPHAARNTNDLLLADDTMDFLDGVNSTLSTPAPPSRPIIHPPLTLSELTPRSKPARAVPVRSSLRPRPGVATPHKAAVATELSAALSEDLSPLRCQYPSFQIPPPQGMAEDLLMADNGANFFEGESSLNPIQPCAHNPSALSRLAPEPSAHIRSTPSGSPNTPRIETPSSQCLSSAQAGDVNMIEKSEQNGAVTHTAASIATDIIPPISEVVHEGKSDQPAVQRPADKGKVNLAERHKKLPGGDKAKRKRVTPAAAVTKPAKLKPLTASLARRASIGKPAPGMRRRPLQGVSVGTAAAGTSVRRAGSTVQSTSSAVHSDVKHTRSGGLADTLMSFGQKLMANATSSSTEQHGKALAETDLRNVPIPESAVSDPIILDHRSDARPVDEQGEKPAGDPSYLTISQLSPRKPGDHGGASAATLASGSHSSEEALAVVLDQPVAEPQVSEGARPPSPMRRSIKRAGSPADEHPAHERKRSKTTSAPSAPASSKERAPHSTTLQPSRARNAPAAASASSAVRARRVVSATASGAKVRSKADDGRKPATATSRSLARSGPSREADRDANRAKGLGRGEMHDGDSGVHVASSVGHDRSRDARPSEKENVAGAQERRTHEQRDGQTSSRGQSPVDRPPSNLPSAKPTRPMEFHFATSTRVEARRADLEKSASSSGNGHSMSLRRSKAQAAHPIPDFKALHALQESMLAQRKAEIVPVVPQPIELSTEARAREREKFEEARRAHEAELERQREERRRQQELEEEREIKELRKRAVPKANEVPEWYAFAPKKSKAGTGN